MNPKLPYQTLDWSRVRAGDILHSASCSFFGRAIRRTLRSEGNHDALMVERGGRLCIAESLYVKGSVVTDCREYSRQMREEGLRVQVLRFPGKPPADDFRRVGNWWLSNVWGRPYDVMAMPKLLIKGVFGDVFPTVAGWEWAYWCTEGVRDAFKNAPGLSRDYDIWRKRNPTPKTTEIRLHHGLLVDVTSECTPSPPSPVCQALAKTARICQPLANPATAPFSVISHPLPGPVFPYVMNHSLSHSF